MWKVFRDLGGAPHFLFHGVAGSTKCPLDRWIAAEIKWRHEGSNPHYWTAFHAYPDQRALDRWCRMVRVIEGRAAAWIDVADTRPKPTEGNAILAERIRVTSEAWAARIPLSCLAR